ncbi:MAG: ATP-binding protein [Candidatus Cloacimonadales bacterium]
MILDSRYEVLEELGSGNWATAYKVKDLRTGTIHALKLFNQIDATEFYKKLPANNMHHITQIQHPNLINVTDFGNIGNSIYALSEFYDGHPLNRFPVSRDNINELYYIVIQICYALHALHSHKIVHKDLKLHNILYRFTASGPQIKVMDYGFSKIDLEGDSQKVTGSIPFIAPEVYLGNEPTPESDFYALGVTLYRLTTGTFPFSIKHIMSVIQGSKDYLLPRLPRQVNSDIPEDFEKLIIRLLEKNPENRFESVPQIIDFINKIQVRRYPFSYQWSTVNYLKFNSYYVNQTISNNLTQYLDAVENENGKLIALVGGKGLGKGDILTLFKYHILTGKYFIFDYECTTDHNDPFYALTKEFHYSVSNNESSPAIDHELTKISDKFKKYLYESEDAAKMTNFSQEDMLADFASLKSYLQHLSDEKPLVFIIRHAELLEDGSIEFMNFCADLISTSRIIIAVAFNNYRLIRKLNEPVIIKVPLLTYEETKSYIIKLLRCEVPEHFLTKIYDRTCGNPVFIQEFLIDLIDNQKIWSETGFAFDYNVNHAPLPESIINSIYVRMSNLAEQSYLYLMELAIIQTPLSKNLIRYFFDIDDLQLYHFITDALNNEILIKRDEFYFYTFPEAKKRFIRESSKEKLIEYSKKLISYFKDIEVTNPEICKGIIENARIAQDYLAIRKYNLVLYHLNDLQHNQDAAFENLINVLKINVLDSIPHLDKNLIKDASLISKKLDIISSISKAEQLCKIMQEYPSVFEKYLILIKIYFLFEDFDNAVGLFPIAEAHVRTAKQSLELKLVAIKIYQRLNLFIEVKEILDEIDYSTLDEKYYFQFKDRKSILMFSSGKIMDAIEIEENIIEKMPAAPDDEMIIIIAVVYNNLGTYYSSIKRLDEAKVYLSKSIALFEKFNIQKQLVLIYNNLGDLYLKQGLTNEGYKLFQKSEELLEKNYNSSTAVLTYINIAEAKLKYGEYSEAKEYLLKAKEISDNVEAINYDTSINRNLALAMSKTSTYKDYTTFVYSINPDLKELKFKELDPLVKTYFYFLYEILATDSLEKLINNNPHISYSKLKEEEFYYNALNLLAITKQDYEVAYRNIEFAKEYAHSSRNIYASTIFKIREIECLIHMDKIDEAEKLYDEALQTCREYHYNYWEIVLKYHKCKIDLLYPNIHLRTILRDLLSLSKICEQNNYLLLEVKILGLTIQVLNQFEVLEIHSNYIINYKKKIEYLVDFANIDIYQQFLDKKQYFSNDVSSFVFERIAPRKKFTKMILNKKISELLQIKDMNRIIFFFAKLLDSLVAPTGFIIATFDQERGTFEEFTSTNCDYEKLQTEEYLSIVDKSFSKRGVTTKKIGDNHVALIPLQIEKTKVGFIMVEDDGDVPYTKHEVTILNSIILQTTTILLRVIDFMESHKRITLMSRLMTVTNKLIGNFTIDKLEYEIVSEGINLLNASRGFFIQIEDSGNYKFTVALDNDNNIVKQYTSIDNNALLKVQQLKKPLYSSNVNEEAYRRSRKHDKYILLSYYCAPVILDNKIYGIIYFDNFIDVQTQLFVNKEIMNLFLLQVNISIRNAVGYNNLFIKNIELVKLDSLKDDFINIVSHELNTPLTKLSTYVRKLKHNLSETPAKREELLKNVESSVFKLINTTNDIITFNKFSITSSLMVLEIEIDELVNLCVQEAMPLSKKRQLSLQADIESDIPTVAGDWESLTIMLNQLILNAIRFTDDFGEISVGVRRSSFQNERLNNQESMVIYVKDNGIGIPEKELENVFKKFYELNDIYSHKSGTIEYRSSGLGLGLSTCKRIVDLNKGKIWIQSKEHEGTIVFVSLPIYKKKADDQN